MLLAQVSTLRVATHPPISSQHGCLRWQSAHLDSQWCQPTHLNSICDAITAHPSTSTIVTTRPPYSPQTHLTRPNTATTSELMRAQAMHQHCVTIEARLAPLSAAAVTVCHGVFCCMRCHARLVDKNGLTQGNNALEGFLILASTDEQRQHDIITRHLQSGRCFCHRSAH